MGGLRTSLFRKWLDSPQSSLIAERASASIVRALVQVAAAGDETTAIGEDQRDSGLLRVGWFVDMLSSSDRIEYRCLDQTIGHR